MNGNKPAPEERKLSLEPLVADAPPLPAETLERIRAAARRKAGLDEAVPAGDAVPAGQAVPPDRTRRPGRARWWLAAAAVLILAGGALVAANPDGALAAIQRLVRLVPGIGLTETDAETLVLPEPVAVEKGGQRLTVTGLISTREGTEVTYRVEGLPEFKADLLSSPRPDDAPQLRLPDGTLVAHRGNNASGGAGTITGTIWFDPLPAGTTDLVLYFPSKWGSESFEVPLPVVDAASAGLAEALAGNWSEERLGARLGVPHWTVQEDRIILNLAVELPDGMMPHDFGPLSEDADELVLTDDRGRVYPLLRGESRLFFGAGDRTSAVFQGPIAEDAGSLRLTAPVLGVSKDVGASLKVAVADLPPGEPLQLDRQLELGSGSITVKTVTRLDEETFLFELDLGPEQDGIMMVDLRVDPVLGPFPTRISGWSSSRSREGRFLTVEFSQDPPPEEYLEVVFRSPELVLLGGWEVELPLQ